MDKPKATGVHHVGIGVRDIDVSRKFYRDVLQCNQVWSDFGRLHNIMPDFFRTSPHIINGWMYAQQQEGIIIECIQRYTPAPRPIHNDPRFGDIGVNKLTVEVNNVDTFVEGYKDKIRLLCEPKAIDIPGWGDYKFVYGADPDGCLIEFISSSKLKLDNSLGRIRSLGISVTDLERSLDFYQKHIDFDTIVIEPHDRFSGLVGEISGNGDTQVRSCLLANSNGYHMLELYEVSNPRGRSIPFHVLWGDYGYLEGCYLCDDILGLTRYFLEEQVEFVCNPTSLQHDEDDGTIRTDWFMYVRDPDGILVEFVELPGNSQAI